MKEKLGYLALFLVAFGLTLTISQAQDKQAQFTIKQVMQKAHKGGLMKKVADGKASAEEKKQLLEFYQALAANTPPKGAPADFKKRADEMVVVAQNVVDGKSGAEAQLLTTVNCQECHKAHK